LIAHHVGKNDRAAELIGRAIALNPNLPEAHNNLAGVLRAMGRFEESAAACRRAIALRPGYADAYNNLGIALSDLGRRDEAAKAYQRAIALNPHLAEPRSNLGNLYKAQGRLDEAIDEFRQAIAINPNFSDAHNNLGNALRDKGELDESIAACRRAIELGPNHADAYNNLGYVLAQQGQYDEAAAALRRAIAISPGLTEAYCNLGSVLRDGGHIDEAVAASRHAISLQPQLAEPHHNLGLALLARGDFEEGWKEYEWRWTCGGFPMLPPGISGTMWDGRPLDGRTILIHAEQGFGDGIQFWRYVPMVAEQGGNIIIECKAELRRLFEIQKLPEVSQIVPRGNPLPAFDCYAAFLSLPGIFGTRLGSIPNSVPYLRADPKDISKWRERMAQQAAKAKIGLVWAGSPTHKNDRHRSIPIEKLKPLMKAEAVQFFSLQKGKAAQEACEINLIDWTDGLSDFAETAALIANLDLVIAADTAVAHVAGAMNKPVWVMLPFAADWRWLEKRTDSPWYPSMRLFRQAKVGDWDGTIARVAEALAAWLKNRR
jgi:tetratricopeptide (TPR) repeat protein